MERRQRVAAPDRRLAEQFRRNERRSGDPFLPDQRRQRDQSEDQKPERHRHRARVDALHLFQRENDRTDKENEKHEARRVERGAAAVALARGNAGDEQHRQQAERNVDQEDRLPAEGLGEIAAGNRAERVRRDGDAGEIALIAAALARRDGFADQGLRQRHQPAAAETLQHAKQREQRDVRRERAEHRADHEDRQRDEHHRAPAERIAEAAIDRCGDGVGDQVGHHHPGGALDFAEVRSDRGQGGCDDGLVGHRQKHRQHDGREDQEELRARRSRGCRRRFLRFLCYRPFGLSLSRPLCAFRRGCDCFGREVRGLRSVQGFIHRFFCAAWFLARRVLAKRVLAKTSYRMPGPGCQYDPGCRKGSCNPSF